MNPSEVRPTRLRVEFTQGGRTALMLMLAGLVATAPFGTNLTLFPACLLAGLTVSVAVAWLSMRALRLTAPGERVVRTGVVFAFPLRLRHVGWAPSARDLLVFAANDGPPTSRALAWIAEVAPRTSAETACEWRTRRRGRRRWLSLRVTSSFPIGLCEVSAHFDAPIDWLSVPRSVRVGVDLDELARRSTVGARSQRRRGDDEFYALRDARPGDSPHGIHWRSSARRGKLVVREFRGEHTPERQIVLLGWTDQPLGALGSSDAFEYAVSIAAALAERHSRRGEGVRFTFDGETSWSVSVAPSRAALQVLLVRLAEVECSKATAEAATKSDVRTRWLRQDVVTVHACSVARGAAKRRVVWASHGAVVERGLRGQRSKIAGGAK